VKRVIESIDFATKEKPTLFKTVASRRVVRFIIVGVGNTLLNFVVLNIAFYALRQPKLIASLIATFFAVIVSFTLNRNFVFSDKSRPLRQLVLFVIVTLSGVLIVQNGIFYVGITLLRGHESAIVALVKRVTGIALATSFVNVNVSNAVAALFVMVWNYNGYRFFVFKEASPPDGVTEIL
jgi:putative flippase GtrA